MSEKKRGLQYGVIGAGSMGRHHLRVANNLPGVKLAAIAEPNKETAKSIPDILKPLIVSDYLELLQKVEAVSIVTPTESHGELGRACLSEGKHVLMEKPLAATSAQAKELVDLASAKSRVLAAGFIERVNPAFVELGRLIKKEKIIGINIKRFSPLPARITDTNVIFDMMIHDLDLLLSLLNTTEIESIRAEGQKIKTKVFDKVAATIFFTPGIVAKLEADRTFGEKKRQVAVTTEKAVYEADLLNQQVIVRDLTTHVPSAHHTKKSDQLTTELKAFVRAIKTGQPPAVDGWAGYKAQQLAEEVEKACS